LSFPAQLILLFFLLALGGCATQPPLYRDDALAALERVRGAGAAGSFSAELASVQGTFDRGEELLQQKEKEEAESYFLLTLQKGALLEKEIRGEQERRQEAERQVAQQKKAELERRAQEEAQRLARARAEAEAKAEAEALAKREAAEAERRKVRPPKEHALVSFYTVKRGESLPFISSQPQVYGDRNLWPLIYRANRDQISDPRHIWPGQALRIPRNLGRDDILEARRYSQERPLH
jgi:nucleoid-associated protein YgaU